MDSSESIPRDALLEHEAFVRKLAARLVRDANDADDLSQETWLALLRRRVAPSALSGLVRSLAWTNRRGSLRRASRENVAAAHEATESADALASRLELQQLVVEHVLALAEPYRSVVLLRFYRDLGPNEIATRLGVPVETVKTRLRRGLAQLREALDRRHGGDRRTWLAALMPFVPGSAPTLAAASGVAVVKSKLAVVSAIVALMVVGGLWLGLALTKSKPPRESVAGTAPVSMSAPLPIEPTPVASVASADELARAEATESELASLGPRLVVVDEATRTPMADAEVWFAPWKEFIPREDGDPDPRDDLATKGRKLVTDTLGTVQLPRFDATLFVGCSHGNLWGDMHIAAGTSGTQTLVLSRERSIALLVVDEAGAPVADCAVGLRVRGERYDDVAISRRTSADGTALIRHVDQQLGEALVPGNWIFATLLIVSAEPIEIGIDPTAFPDHPLRLVLPAAGKIVVELEDEHGEPFTQGTWVSLMPLVRRRGDPTLVDFAQRQSIYTDGSQVTFPRVCLGARLRADVGLWGRRPALMEIDSPTTSGEEVRVTMRVGALYPSVIGRALDERGMPLANRALMRTLELHWDESQRTDLNPLNTDADGRFRSIVNVDVDGETWGSIELSTRDDVPPALGAKLELARAVHTSEIDLGDVRLEPQPLIASGIVVDSSGAPVDGAQLDLVRLRAPGADGPPYQWLDPYRAMSAADGTFEFFGRPPTGECAVMCRKLECLDADFARFSNGETGLRIVLRKYGTLAGSLLVDESVPPEWLHVTVRGTAPGAKLEQVRPDAGFVISALAPGRSSVSVKLDLHSEPLLTIEDVLVEEGNVTRDPRLQSVDLRNELRRIDIDVESATKAPVDNGYVAYAPSGEAGERRCVWIEHGRASLLTLAASVDLEVVAVGHRPVSLANVRTSTRVRLERGISVRVRLPEEVPLPTPPAKLRLALVGELGMQRASIPWIYSQDGSDAIDPFRWIRYLSAAFDDSREIVLSVPDAGRYTTVWRFESDDGRSTTYGLGSNGGPDEIEIVDIVDDGLEHVLMLAPDLGQLRELLEKLR